MLLKLLTTSTFCAIMSANAVFAVTWDLANEYPANSLPGQTADVFAKAVKEKTNGEVEVIVHHGAALGYKSIDQFDAVGDGSLMAASSTSVAWPGIDPIFQLSSLPFLAPTVADAKRLYELAIPDYDAVFAANNQMRLLATPWPSSGLWGKKAFTTPEDIQGVKVRTYDVASTETLKNAGAFPIQVSWADVPAQLSTNAIDAVLTSANGGIGVQMWELQSHFTSVNYAASLQFIHVNMDAWNDLTEDQQKAVREAAAEAEKFGWDLQAEATEADFATMESHKMTVTREVPQAFATYLTEAAQPFINGWIETTGERATKILDAYNAK